MPEFKQKVNKSIQSIIPFCRVMVFESKMKHFLLCDKICPGCVLLRNTPLCNARSVFRFYKPYDTLPYNWPPEVGSSPVVEEVLVLRAALSTGGLWLAQ